MSKYNIWNKWDPLEAVMLGTSYNADFFRDMKDIRARNALQRIADETCEDLEGFERILKDFGCEVIRPDIDKNDSISMYIDRGDLKHNVPRAPLQPRDHHLIIGDKAICTPGADQSINSALYRYDNDNTYNVKDVASWPKYVYDTLALRHDNWPNYEEYKKHWNKGSARRLLLPEEFIRQLESIQKNFELPLGSANTFPIGTKLFANTSYFSSQDSIKAVESTGWIDNFEIVWHEFDGHTDGNFHPIKPGAIISLLHVMHYEKTFPGWDVLHLVEESWDKIDGFLQLKDRVNGKWWVPGEENNDHLTDFVETWLNDWVGYVEETVFDVNVLMLDEHHCCVSNPNNEQVNAFLKKHNVEPVYVPWRHRYFWDGGLHCITLDLKRRGKQQNYFK